MRTYTTAVEIYQGDNLHCLTVWCLRCIDEAEQRSQPHGTPVATGMAAPAADTVDSAEQTRHATSFGTFQQFVQEHLQLMDRALYDDEASLIPVIQDFMERCRLYQPHLAMPEQCQRLTGHLHYWETFLKALNS